MMAKVHTSWRSFANTFETVQFVGLLKRYKTVALEGSVRESTAFSLSFIRQDSPECVHRVFSIAFFRDGIPLPANRRAARR